MSFLCPSCKRHASLRIPLPDHIQSVVRCRYCRVYMIPVTPHSHRFMIPGALRRVA